MSKAPQHAMLDEQAQHLGWAFESNQSAICPPPDGEMELVQKITECAVRMTTRLRYVPMFLRDWMDMMGEMDEHMAESAVGREVMRQATETRLWGKVTEALLPAEAGQYGWYCRLMATLVASAVAASEVSAIRRTNLTGDEQDKRTVSIRSALAEKLAQIRTWRGRPAEEGHSFQLIRALLRAGSGVDGTMAAAPPANRSIICAILRMGGSWCG